MEGERRRRRLRRGPQPAADQPAADAARSADPPATERSTHGPLDMPSRASRPDARPDDRAARPDDAARAPRPDARPNDAARAPRPDDAARTARPDARTVDADGEPFAETAPVHDPEPEPPRPPTSAEEREAERGLRGLVGSGTSQVRTGAALRARDAARPTDADLATAEEHLIIVRRNWVPREDLPRTR